jgi:hypothetical protein
MHRVGAAPAVLGLALVAFVTVAWVYLGATFVVIVFLPTVVAFIAWLRTTYPHPVRSERVVAIYLLAIAVQFVHLSEEFVNRFWDYSNAMFAPAFLWDERFFTMLFMLAFPFLFVVGAIGLLLHTPFGNYLVWWFALGPNMANFVAHLVFPVIYGGYVAGLYTAPLHGAMSLFLLWTLVRHHRDNVAAARRPAPLRGALMPRAT